MQTLIAPLVQLYLESPAGKEMLEKRVAKLVSDALDSATGYNTEFKKSLDSAVAQSLGLPSGIDLPSYNHTILTIVQRQVEALHAGAIQKQIAERMKDLLKPVPESIKLSEVVEAFRQHCHEKATAGCSCDGEARITIVKKERDSYSYGGTGRQFMDYGLDQDKGTAYNQCEIRFGVYGDEMYTLNFSNRDLEKELFVGPFHGFERMLFQMRAAKTKIIIDGEPDDFETSYGPSYD